MKSQLAYFILHRYRHPRPKLHKSSKEIRPGIVTKDSSSDSVQCRPIRSRLSVLAISCLCRWGAGRNVGVCLPPVYVFVRDCHDE